MSAPRVSIGIPAYNNADAIVETVASALAQDYPDLEVVIADHGSTDGTAALLEQFRDDPRVRILSPTPAGGGAERNWDRVSRAARGEYFKLLCGDDLLDPGAVSAQVAALDAHPSAVMVASRRRIVDAHGPQDEAIAQAAFEVRHAQASVGLLHGRGEHEAQTRTGRSQPVQGRAGERDGGTDRRPG